MKRYLTLTLLLTTALLTLAADAVPRYIFYIIGDGMGLGAVTAAQNYNTYALGSDDDLLMLTFPVASFAATASASSPVTDSAAAGTALATGTRTRNGMIGMTADTIPVPSLAVKLQERGWGIGIVTSNAPDDATPAAFYAHVANRGQYYDIGCQAAEAGLDFIGGANLRGAPGTDLMQRFASAGIQVAYGIDEYRGTEAERVLVLGDNRSLNNTLGYTLDSIPSMTLPQLTALCLQHLERYRPERFFMMVEHGLIDWTGHANDAGSNVAEVNKLQQTLEVAYRFYEQHPDETLIIVTADHETGGLSIGNADTGYWADFNKLRAQTMSKEAFSNLIKQLLADSPDLTWQQMQQLLRTKMGLWGDITVSDAQEQVLHRMFDDIFTAHSDVADQATLYGDYNAFAVEVFRIIDSATGIGWVDTYHTGNPVPVFAIGVGAERFVRYGHIADIPARLEALLGISK